MTCLRRFAVSLLVAGMVLGISSSAAAEIPPIAVPQPGGHDICVDPDAFFFHREKICFRSPI